MKKLRKMLAPAVAMLITGIVALTGVTYAWFEQGKESKVSSFDADVAAASGILMSWDAQTWMNTISVTDKNYNGTDMSVADWAYTDVSTTAAANNGALTFYKAKLKNDKIVETVVQQSGFVKFDLYFQVMDDNTVVKLADTAAITGTDSDTMTARLASRVAFINQGCDPTFTAETAKAVTAEGASTALIWEPNATEHVVDGALQTGSKLNYYGVDAVQTGDYGRNEDNAVLSAVSTKTANADVNFTLNKGINKVTVYVWIEGQDADCINLVAGKPIRVQLDFVIVEE